MKNDDVIKDKEIAKIVDEMFILANVDFDNDMAAAGTEPPNYAAHDILKKFLLSEIKKVREECYEQMSEIIGEDDKYPAPGNHEYMKVRNVLRAEQRSKLQALKDKV